MDGRELLKVVEKRERLGEDVETEGEGQGQEQGVKRRATSPEQGAPFPSSSPLISSQDVDQVALSNVRESGQQSALVTFIRVGEKKTTVENQVQKLLALKFRQWLTFAPQG